jgi:hypothetical protein
MSDYLIPIRRWAMDGRLGGISHNALENSLRLARGRLSLALILWEPIWDEGTYAEMMQRCVTLQEINALIRNVSHGRYSIEDVTLLDVRVLLSKRRMEGLTSKDDIFEAAYDVFQEVIRMKRPDVILTLQCQTSAVRNVLARQLSSKFLSSPNSDKVLVEGHTTTVIKGFHPSLYLNYNKIFTTKMHLRWQLRNKFQLAFESLTENRVDREKMPCKSTSFSRLHSNGTNPRGEKKQNARPEPTVKSPSTLKRHD